LAVKDGENIRIADEPAQFAQRVLELLASPEERRRIGKSGRALVEKRYDWQEIAKLLESAWFEACSPDRTDDLRSGATQGEKELV
jgi:polysaccharide biosynthesis protein PslH